MNLDIYADKAPPPAKRKRPISRKSSAKQKPPADYVDSLPEDVQRLVRALRRLYGTK